MFFVIASPTARNRAPVSADQPTYLVVGATSGIGRALCRRLAGRGWGLILAARDADEMQRISDDLRVRHGRDFPTVAFDARDQDQVRSLLQRAVSIGNRRIHGAIICHGMSPQDTDGFTEDVLRETWEVNFTSAALILTAAARYLETQGGGLIAAVSSVAGDRGRQSNFPYGAAKAALSTYLQGLRNRFQSRGVHVVTIKPGFVDTPMMRGQKSAPRFLVASPERVAADIERAIIRRRNIVYTPWFWWSIMAVVCAIPEPVFKRLKL